jgi:hypothetical protein
MRGVEPGRIGAVDLPERQFRSAPLIASPSSVLKTAVRPGPWSNPVNKTITGETLGLAGADANQEDEIPSTHSDDQTDVREALYNDGGTGPAGRIQIPRERISALRGFVIDLDPHLLRPDNSLFPPSENPRVFHQQIGPVLDRHPLARHAEVRDSGRGLHLLVLIEPPVQLHTSGEQRYWDAIVKIVQRTLPADPRAPGITALTRALGSINSKNGRAVELLKKGAPVSPDEVLRFAKDVGAAPFRTIAEILLGAERVECCPLCQQQSLTVYEREGRCYQCGKVRMDALLDAVFVVKAERTAPEEPRGTTRARKGGKKRVEVEDDPPPVRQFANSV